MKLKFTILLIILFFMQRTNAQQSDDIQIQVLQLEENGNFPNNPDLPVLLYKKVFDFENASDPASVIEQVLHNNNWGGSWRNGIYTFQHYHSTAHEALGVYGGWPEVQLGGPDSKIVRIEKGDLVVLPVGTAHKKIDSGDGFAVVGAYPDGQNWDMNYGKAEELEKANQNISKVKLPSNDPLTGKNGKMFDHWK